MKITECLNTEHGVFLRQLGVLERLLDEKAPAEAIRAATLTIASAVELHRDVEESLLYTAIRRVFGEDFPPLRVMEAEHREIERCFRGIDARAAETPDLARAFIGVLRQHIAKEIQVLFPMAEERLEPGELERLACRCVEQYHTVAGVTLAGHR